MGNYLYNFGLKEEGEKNKLKENFDTKITVYFDRKKNMKLVHTVENGSLEFKGV